MLWFLKFIFIVFFFYHLIPLCPSHPCNHHHTVVHVHESFFYFAWFLHPVTTPPRAISLLSICESSLFCLLVQFVHWIPRMSEIIWYVSFFDWLISLSIMIPRSNHAVAKVKILFLFYGQVVFHCVYVPWLFYPLIYWWTLGRLPYLGNCK